MHWKVKAAIQNLVALLPSRLGNQAYYFLQRHVGSLKRPDPARGFGAGVQLIRRIQEAGYTVVDKSFVEVGTGHRLYIPLALWLCGARQIITIDPHPYLRGELIQEDLAFLRELSDDLRRLFEDRVSQALFNSRLSELLKEGDFDLHAFLGSTNIDYGSPANVAHLNLDAQSVDFHISYTTLEHIPPSMLMEVLKEGRRVLKREGLLVHYIDMSDHFAHSDRSISTVNFLQFSATEWHQYAGSRFAYHNRLRLDEHLDIFKAAGLTIISLQTQIDPVAFKALQNGECVDERTRNRPAEINAISGAWLIAQ